MSERIKTKFLMRYLLESMTGRHLEEVRQWYALTGNTLALQDVIAEQQRRKESEG